MAAESVISVDELESEVTSEPQSKPSLEVSHDGYELIHSKSPVFYDLYERKSELKNQTHYCPGVGTEWLTT